MKSRATLRISSCVTASAVERTQGRPIRPICFRRQQDYHGFPALKASRPTRCLGPGTKKASATNADQHFQASSWRGLWSSFQPGALIARLRSGRVLISALQAERSGTRVWTTSRNSTVYRARFSTAKRSPANPVPPFCTCSNPARDAHFRQETCFNSAMHPMAIRQITPRTRPAFSLEAWPSQTVV